jgi:hypothetical protein
LLVVEEAPRWRPRLGNVGVGTDKLKKRTRQEEKKNKRKKIPWDRKAPPQRAISAKDRVRWLELGKKTTYSAIVRVRKTSDILDGHCGGSGMKWTIVVRFVVAHAWTRYDRKEGKGRKSPQQTNSINPAIRIGYLALTLRL